jgi:hypothetical protein
MVSNRRLGFSTSSSIGEPLTLEAFQGNFGTALVIVAQLFEGALAEIKRSSLTLQAQGKQETESY